jgi:hypothetical protein
MVLIDTRLLWCEKLAGQESLEQRIRRWTATTSKCNYVREEERKFNIGQLLSIAQKARAINSI